MESKNSLGISIQEVLQKMKAAGYHQSTISNYQRIYNRLIRIATEMKIDKFCEPLAERFAEDSANRKTAEYCHSRKCLHNSCIRKLRECAGKGFVGWMTCVEKQLDTPASDEFQTLHTIFLDYLASENKSKNTIDSYRNVSCKFLTFIEKKGFKNLGAVPVESIHEFFCDLRTTWSSGSLRTAAAGLRSFLSFEENGSRLLPAVPEKLLRKKSIIPVLAPEEVQSIWDVLKTELVSLRNKAIMSLLLLTGLRAVDIVNLKLSDINWKCDVISINQKKTNKPLVLPLIPAFGNAIAAYLMNARPQSDSPYVFLTTCAPYKPLKDHSACYSIVRNIFTHAGIRSANELIGTRLIRHQVASTMLKKGVTIQTISMTLGHVNPDSADVYITTDDERLRECALALSGIPLKVGGLL